MQRHKIERIVKKPGGNFQVVFRDGKCVFWPREYAYGLDKGLRVNEHKNKKGQTVAFSWKDNIRFIGEQPIHFDESVDFIENFKFFDRVPFNIAVLRALGYGIEPLIYPDTENFAHNMVLLAVKHKYTKER